MENEFKVGQFWVSRSGETFKIVDINDKVGVEHPIIAINIVTGITEEFTSGGFYYDYCLSNNDLVGLINHDGIKTKEKSDDMCIVCRLREKRSKGEQLMAHNGDSMYTQSENNGSSTQQVKQNPNRHKYADVIHAFAEGAQIQYKMDDYDWTDTTAPCFGATNIEFRIKPKTRIECYRMALTSNGVLSVNVTNSSLDNPAEYEVQGFIKWLGDIVKVEVNE